MLLTLTTTYVPATDIGFLLHKNPGALHSKTLPFGVAHVFYPEATEEKCTAALLLDIDPVGLVRKDKGAAFPLEHYVNDRPYVASSFLSVAINRVFGTLLSGKSKQRQDLVDKALPLEAVIYALPCQAGEALLQDLFVPLGYDITLCRSALDATFPEWGQSPYYTVTLRKNCPLRELLIHLYVLMPVLDNKKHYFIGDAEVEKLLHYGEGWLKDHPKKEAIAYRSFRNLRSFSRMALDRLQEEEPLEDQAQQEEAEHHANAQEEALEQTLPQTLLAPKTPSLNAQRYQSVLAVLKDHQSRTVLDLGCGEGKLLRLLQKEKQFAKIAGCDVAMGSLAIAQDRLKPEQQSRGQPEILLFQSSLTYRDARFAGYDAISLIEVIEHVDEARLGALERVVFEHAKPPLVIVTTPNKDYNSVFETLPAVQFRHADHRFEWTRADFQNWAHPIAAERGYEVTFHPIGTEHETHGGASQMAVFVKTDCENTNIKTGEDGKNY